MPHARPGNVVEGSAIRVIIPYHTPVIRGGNGVDRRIEGDAVGNAAAVNLARHAADMVEGSVVATDRAGAIAIRYTAVVVNLAHHAADNPATGYRAGDVAIPDGATVPDLPRYAAEIDIAGDTYIFQPEIVYRAAVNTAKQPAVGKESIVDKEITDALFVSVERTPEGSRILPNGPPAGTGVVREDVEIKVDFQAEILADIINAAVNIRSQLHKVGGSVNKVGIATCTGAEYPLRRQLLRHKRRQTKGGHKKR